MMNLFINPNNEYPRHTGDILLEYPDFDGINLPEGWKTVEPTDPPVFGEGQILEELFPEFINGAYKQTWNVRTLTAQEIKTLSQLQSLA